LFYFRTFSILFSNTCSIFGHFQTTGATQPQDPSALGTCDLHCGSGSDTGSGSGSGSGVAGCCGSGGGHVAFWGVRSPPPMAYAGGFSAGLWLWVAFFFCDSWGFGATLPLPLLLFLLLLFLLLLLFFFFFCATLPLPFFFFSFFFTV
jgi:hypothetical protein